MDDLQRIAQFRIGVKHSKNIGPKIQYHLVDHLGSSTLIINDKLNWISREEYTPYGTTSYGSFSRKRFRYSGKERVEESGLYFFGVRYYAPWLARWINVDRDLKSHLSEGSYKYALCNPMRYIDENGCESSEGKRLYYLTGMSPFIGGATAMALGKMGVVGGTAATLWGVGAILGILAFIALICLVKIVGKIVNISSYYLKNYPPRPLHWINYYSKDKGKKSIPNNNRGVERKTIEHRTGIEESSNKSNQISPAELSSIIKSWIADSSNSNKSSSLSKASFTYMLQKTFGKEQYAGLLLPGINGLKIDMDFINTFDETIFSDGYVPVFEPGVGVGYSIFGEKKYDPIFSIGVSPSSENVPYFFSNMSQPFSGNSQGFFFGAAYLMMF